LPVLLNSLLEFSPAAQHVLSICIIICYAGQLQAVRALPPPLADKYTLLAPLRQLIAAIVANLIGGLIFFWVDQFIFYISVTRCAMGSKGEHNLRGLWENRTRVPSVEIGGLRQNA
jgi:hypothetical protein